MPTEEVEVLHSALRNIIRSLLTDEGINLNRLKIKTAREYNLGQLPTNAELLEAATEEERGALLPLLQMKPVRSISGVNVVAVMTPPHPCPHGRCAYCPNIPGVPNSYTGKEPSAMRGLQNGYDPYKQVKNRLAQLKRIGHPASKVEIIVQGGTFPSVDIEQQRDFLRNCLDAVTEKTSRSFEEAALQAERSASRNVGVTFETRPDCCDEKVIDNMLSLGVTRVELGVQTLQDEIYRLVDRGHTVQDVIDATQRLKDVGLKVCYHMMPGLPSTNYEDDVKTFERLFDDPKLRPDMLKIYPCLVLEGTKIHDWWKQGVYRPYTTEEAVELLSEIKAKMPSWVRIMRVQRDIPAQLIVAGVKKSNLRQLVRTEMAERKLRCHCIRCREVGHRMLADGFEPPQPDDLELTVAKYEASEGAEFLVSIEEPVREVLIGYLRLRFPSGKSRRTEVSPGSTGIIRELHIYGTTASFEHKAQGAWQHRGYGRKLMEQAETICQEHDAKRIVVTSALGVRQYFRRLGYEQIGPYMGKILS